MTPEEKARQEIDAQLTRCGWTVQTKDRINLSATPGIAVCELSFATGEPDYTLFVDGKAIGTTEAKPEGATLTGVEEQSAKYVSGLPSGVPAWKYPLPFCYESTGKETFFTNRLDPDPRSRRVFSFHRPETLRAWVQHVAGGGSPLAQRLRELPPLVGDSLWPAQIQAIRNLEKSFAAGRPRALIQMATGSGKTYTAVNFIYRLVKYAGARRVLFLVDRGNLGRQTLKEFQQFVSPVNNYKFTEEYIVQHLSGNSLDKSARVVIGTIQRIYSMLKGEKEPAPDLDDLPIEAAETLFKQPVPVEYNPAFPIEEFDFIITDECHRSKAAKGQTLSEISKGMLSAIDPDEIQAQAKQGKGEYHEPSGKELREVRETRIKEALAPLASNPDLRNLLKQIQKAADQTIDIISRDTLVYAGPAQKSTQTSAQVANSFREYIEQHKAEITALQILYSRPHKQRLTEPMLKELEKKLRDNHAAWTEDRLWDAFALTRPGKVKGRSQAGRFADLVALVRFALEQQPVLAPFADSVTERFNEWLMDKAKAGVKFNPEQLAWLNLIRDHIATAISIEPEDLDLSPFNQRGGLGKAHQLFGEQLPKLLDELNEVLAA